MRDIQDQTAEALADVITHRKPDDVLISANALRDALMTLGIPVGLSGLAAEAQGNREIAQHFNGMAKVINLLIDGTEIAIGRGELETL